MIDIIQVSKDVRAATQPLMVDLMRLHNRGLHSVLAVRADGEWSLPLSVAQQAVKAREVGLVFRHAPVSEAAPTAQELTRAATALEGLPGAKLVFSGDGKRALAVALVAEARRAGWEADRIIERASELGRPLGESLEAVVRELFPAPAPEPEPATPA